MKVHEQLVRIQKELEAPKGQHNSFGNYNYRSCEDILGAVKPLLGPLTLRISDEIVLIGDRYYVKATACLSDGNNDVCNTAYAREQDAKFNKEGRETMDHAQITGSTSSYARKYALNGLFAIDDTKDADSMDNTSSKPFAQTRTTTKMEGGAVSTPERNPFVDPIDEWDNAEPPVSTAPVCQLHNVPFEKKNGKFGEFYSHRLEDGSYCNKK